MPIVESKRLIHVDPAKVRLRSSDVLQVLVDHDRPMNTEAVGKALHLETNDRNHKDIQGRLCYLAQRGLAVRVMAGVYRAASDAYAIAARVQHDVHNADKPQPSTPQAATSAPVPTAPQSAQAAVNHVVESIDDTIEAILDLLLPKGFRAADLRFIAPWIEQTRMMVEKINGHS